MFHFEYDGNIYVGGGYLQTGSTSNRVWAYDVANGTWTQKADFPGGARGNAVGFSLGDFAYVGAGFDGTNHLSDFWKYDPAMDSWTQIDDFPGGKRSHPLVNTTGTAAYLIGGGRAGDNTFFRDTWVFNRSSETWQQLDDYPGSGSWRLFGWVIGDKMYVGGGEEFPNGTFTDFYRFDLGNNTWSETAMPDCPTTKTSGGYSFTLQGKGYYCEGYNGQEDSVNDFGKRLFSFDPVAREWSEGPSFPGASRVLGFSVAVDGKAYVGGGSNFVSRLIYRDFYEFAPSTTSSRSVAYEEVTVKAFPNPISQDLLTISGDFTSRNQIIVRLYDLKGSSQQLPAGTTRYATDGSIQLDVNNLTPGMYQVETIQGEKRGVVRFLRL